MGFLLNVSLPGIIYTIFVDAICVKCQYHPEQLKISDERNLVFWPLDWIALREKPEEHIPGTKENIGGWIEPATSTLCECDLRLTSVTSYD